jgi:RHS repeat-associated protein
VSWILDRNHRQRDFAYDINDNLTTETWDNGTKLTFSSDKVGNLKSSYDASSNTTDSYGYDAIYQLTSAATSNSNVKFQYNYDEFGDLTQRKDLVGTNPIATLDYTYNNNHQLTYLTQAGVGLTTQNIGFSYDKLSQLRQIDRQSASNPGHLITTYAYDTAGRLFDLNNRFNSMVISHYGYSYDDGNRSIGQSGTDGIKTIDYGKDNQLQSVVKTVGTNEAYNFNALGIQAGWATDPQDKRRVLNDGSYQYQYDNEGNLTWKQEIATGKVTDYRNRLTKVVIGSQTIEYLYDAEDKRVGKKVNGVTTEKYVYDGADIALVVDGLGTIVERYLYGDGTDNVFSRDQAGAVVWSLADKQGSVVDLVNESGTVLNHFVYDSFGSRTGVTGAEFRFGYTGRELDGETGLYYYRARYYDPKVGRFISEDPLGFGAGDTNLYRYVNNSPTNFTDPTGTTISGWADDALNGFDSFVAGFANVVSFGLTNKIREVLPNGAGKIAKLNQEGLLYNLGTGVGFAASLALNPAGAGASVAKGFAAGYQATGVVLGALESTGNILSGHGDAGDLLNLLPVALHVGGSLLHGAACAE